MSFKTLERIFFKLLYMLRNESIIVNGWHDVFILRIVIE